MNVFRNQHDSRLTDRQNLPALQVSGKLRSRQLRRRYGTELLGALLFIAAVIAFNSLDHRAAASGTKTQSSATHSTILSQQGAPTDNQVSPPVTSDTTTVSKGDTTMSESANNDATTRVTVNGVDVPVPTNGTSQQTVVGDGSPTSVTISSGQSTTGQASGTNRTSTHLNVSTTTHSNDSTAESWSETP